jgi:hypothetical protein
VSDWIKTLTDLLEESGAKVTFSANCCSGIVGDKCQCWRCRKDRGEEAKEDPGWQKEAAGITKEWRKKQLEWFRSQKEAGK